jgi:hypothetical protein
MKKNIQCAAWVSRKFIPKIIFLCPGANPGSAKPGQQTNSKFMKNNPNQAADVPDLSAEAERAVFDSHIHQTLEHIEGNVAAHESVRSDRHEYSALQDPPRHGHACFRCPRCLGSCRSLCRG